MGLRLRFLAGHRNDKEGGGGLKTMIEENVLKSETDKILVEIFQNLAMAEELSDKKSKGSSLYGQVWTKKERNLLRKFRNRWAHSHQSYREDGGVELRERKGTCHTYSLPQLRKERDRIRELCHDRWQESLNPNCIMTVTCNTCGDITPANKMLTCGHVTYSPDARDGRFLAMKPEGGTLRVEFSMSGPLAQGMRMASP